MNRFGPPLLAAAAALLLPVADALPAPRSPATAPRLRNARLSRLLGMTVEDPNVQKLGTVKDFVLNAPSAQVEYAIISSGGVLGLGADNRALPVSALSIATIVRGVLGASVTRQQWHRYPAFTGNPAALPDPPPSTPEIDRRVAATAPARQKRLELASNLLGATILNREHQHLGTVSDLLLDLNRRKPALVLIRNARFLHGQETFAVPLPLLARAQGDQLLLDASLQRLEQAPVFTEQAWSAAATQDTAIIFRVPGSAET